MAYNLGKKFEERFEKDFQSLGEDVSVDRIKDTMGKRYGVSNICDYICYSYPNAFYIELKSHKGNTFPLSNLTQYDKLKDKIGKRGVRVGVIVWFRDHDKVTYTPISEVKRMFENDVKSINIKYLETKEYKVYEIPSKKLRVFMESDYSMLLSLKEGE